MRILFLFFLPLSLGIITEQKINDEVDGCFNEAFGFNTRMVNQYIDASVIINQLEECLKRDPLYIQQTDYIENVLRTDIVHLQNNVTNLQQKQRDSNLFPTYVSHILNLISGGIFCFGGFFIVSFHLFVWIFIHLLIPTSVKKVLLQCGHIYGLSLCINLIFPGVFMYFFLFLFLFSFFIY